MTNHGKVRKLRDCLSDFPIPMGEIRGSHFLVAGTNLPRNEEEVNLLYDS